jgi:hypothetical protein
MNSLALPIFLLSIKIFTHCLRRILVKNRNTLGVCTNYAIF